MKVPGSSLSGGSQFFEKKSIFYSDFSISLFSQLVNVLSTVFEYHQALLTASTDTTRLLFFSFLILLGISQQAMLPLKMVSSCIRPLKKYTHERLLSLFFA